MEPIIENDLRDIGITKITGVDEVGRGALCHAVVVAAVTLPINHHIEGINDSKKLSPKKREKIAALINERAFDVQLSYAMNGAVDKIGIFNATRRCMVEVVNSLKLKPEMVVIDGKFPPFEGDYKLNHPYEIIEKADTLSESVAAASIIAKVCRDQMLLEADKLYPMYGFCRNKGYGTKEHYEALLKYGPCPLHRMSFSIKGKKIGDL